MGPTRVQAVAKHLPDACLESSWEEAMTELQLARLQLDDGARQERLPGSDPGGPSATVGVALAQVRRWRVCVTCDVCL